jgi:hypothetical protein
MGVARWLHTGFEELSLSIEYDGEGLRSGGTPGANEVTPRRLTVVKK